MLFLKFHGNTKELTQMKKTNKLQNEFVREYPVSCGGRCGQRMGFLNSNVHTNRLLVWETLEALVAIFIA
jgi:hypothetical protein